MDGLGDGGVANVKLATGTVNFAADVIDAVAGFHGDGQADEVFGNIIGINLILQFAGGFAFGVNRANVGQSNVAVLLDGFLVAGNFNQ